MVKAGIFGASGYTGQELLRILLRHPGVRVTAVTSRRYAGLPVSQVYPAFLGTTPLAFRNASPQEIAAEAELVFLALPHGVSHHVAGIFLAADRRVIDLSADFRLRDRGLYEAWYGPHPAPELLAEAVYGIPELYREAVRNARLVANPGCYPTSVILGLAPVLAGGWIDPATVIIDSKSGVSGAGREPAVGSLFGEVQEGFKAYKVGTHRHTPEIEQELGRIAGRAMTVSFTPHLLPATRGILSTMYATLSRETSTAALAEEYRTFYRDEAFVRICPEGTFPNISSVRGTNLCHIGVHADGRTGRAVIVSAVDNLVKGAAGQAVQNMNLVCGLPETQGLDLPVLYP